MKRDVHGDGRPQKVSVPHCPLCGESARNCMRLPHTEVWKCLNPSCALMFAFPQLDDLALGAAYQNFYYPAPDTGIAAYENTPERILRQAFDKAEAEFGPLAGKSLLAARIQLPPCQMPAAEFVRGDFRRQRYQIGRAHV